MPPSADRPSELPDAGRVAAALVGAEGLIEWWSAAAEDLLGWEAGEVLGTPARRLLVRSAGTGGADTGWRPVRLSGRDRGTVDAWIAVVGGSRVGSSLVLAVSGAPSPSASAPVSVSVSAPADDGGDRDEHRDDEHRDQGRDQGEDRSGDIARALFTQDRIAVAEFDVHLRLVRSNEAFRALRPADAGSDWFLDLVGPGGGERIGQELARVVDSGRSMAGRNYRLGVSETGRTHSLAGFRISDRPGTTVGVAVMVVEGAWDLRSRRLVESYRRAFEIGSSLDVVTAARELVDLVVPALGDLGCVDFPDDVLQGRDPPLGYPGMRASRPRRVAVKSASGPWPTAMTQAGETVPIVEEHPQMAAVSVGGAFVLDPASGRALLSHDPRLIAQLMPQGMRTAVVCPLYHRSRLFGSLQLWRTDNPAPFDEDDLGLVQDLCDRAAVVLDNAHRYTREHSLVVALQRSLLPPAATRSAACETAGTYLPAGGSVSAGGDWFDTIALSSLRTALVVGDVIGHGLPATATMARLRTAVQTLADLDLPPDELLTRLDDLVRRMAAESEYPDTVGATCLFVVYDPVTGHCHMASAGHPPPALLLPGGTACHIPLTPGPPLGVGEHPFEVWSGALPPGSTLALYTDGLTGHDPTHGMSDLLTHLTEASRPERSLADIGTELVDRRPGFDGHPDDDVTLLIARTQAVPDENIRRWEYPADVTAVHTARADANAQLQAWGLEEQMFATELVVSELVTNAIRYAGGPIGLLLVRDHVLVCEVSDSSNTQPRLRRALNTDEGGRGLFLVAQLTNRWGSRYSAHGKTIWTEQNLP
ncbi:SpoIIE family protein phosphatase [Kitasatospora sp. NBC_00315]|uniref:SpoIIE family protein phosphatase n=1 Tax=Kitasatospora sp. NBC_00315 TaxID=2975963 RepID=UPI003255917F